MVVHCLACDVDVVLYCCNQGFERREVPLRPQKSAEHELHVRPVEIVIERVQQVRFDGLLLHVLIEGIQPYAADSLEWASAVDRSPAEVS